MMRAKLLAVLALLSALSADPSRSATMYAYDSLGRLWMVTYDNGMQITYTYDAAGNRSQVVTQTGTGLPPQANNDAIKVSENVADTFNPLTNDTDPYNYTLSITAVGTPSHGTATKTSTSVTYTPTTGYVGSDSFSYTISDGHSHTASATISATVGGVSPRVANNDSVSTSENTAITFDPRANDTDANGYTLTITATTAPSHGTVTINSGTSLTYTPASGYIGSDSFTYTISDGHGQTDNATVSVGVGDPPVAVADLVETALNTPLTFDPRINDSDSNGFTLNVASTATPAHGAVTINSGGSTLTYTPTTGYSGLDTFSYTISDGHGLSATATDSVCTGYQPPTAVADTILIAKVVHVAIVPTATMDPINNDVVACGLTPTITAVTQGAHGTVTIGSTQQTVTYTYYTSVTTLVQNNVDSFTYTITDPFGATSTATVTVNFDITYSNND